MTIELVPVAEGTRLSLMHDFAEQAPRDQHVQGWRYQLALFANAVTDVQHDGAAIRYHKMFSPSGTNVNFIEKRGRNKIAIRTYERGVEDETLACGTGIVASALIFAASEDCEGPVTVLARGGDELQVSFERTGNQFRNVTLTGPAEFVFEGTIEV